jgi:hypothetical protein
MPCACRPAHRGLAALDVARVLRHLVAVLLVGVTPAEQADARAEEAARRRADRPERRPRHGATDAALKCLVPSNHYA